MIIKNRLPKSQARLLRELKQLVRSELQHAARLRKIELALRELLGYIEYKHIETLLGRYDHERSSDWLSRAYRP